MITLLLALLSCRSDDAAAPAASPTPTPLRTGTDRCETLKRPNAEIFKVDDDIYLVRAKGKGAVPNKLITFVVTKEGVVAFDAGTMASAAVSKEVLREFTDQPIKYLIFSHHHGTNIQGTEALLDPDTKIVAHADFPVELARTKDLLEFNRRLNNIQFDLDVPEDKPMDGPSRVDITYADKYDFELGGVKFELHHVEGEARDYTVLWLPERKMAWIGDLATPLFPMVASPMKPVRDPIRWKAALDHVIALEPEIMVNDVNPPWCDKAEIAPFLQVQSDLLGWLYEQVIDQMNAGNDVNEAVRNIVLPERFKGLKEAYGSLEFSVRGVYDLYSGWFDMNGTHIRPPPRPDLAKRFVESMGGTDAVLEDAAKALADDRSDLALEYLDLVIDDSADVRAYAMKAEILAALSEQPSPNGVLKSMYRKLSDDAAEAAGIPSKTKSKAAKAKGVKTKAKSPPAEELGDVH